MVPARWAVVGLLGALACDAARAGNAPGADDWKYDVVYCKTGPPMRGLIVDRNSDPIKIKCITRKPGKPTLVFDQFVLRRDVARMELLEKADREKMEKRLDGLKREREHLTLQLRLLGPKGKGAPRGEEMIDLREATWPGKVGGKGLGYQSAHFQLVSNARSEVVQLAALHLEQIYAAYARALPPRAPKGKPTTIVLARSVADYRAIARERGLNLFNPAFYDPERNQVVCGSDLERLYDEIEKARARHAALRREIKERKRELQKAYGGKAPAELLAPLVEAGKRMEEIEGRNEGTFVRNRQRLFRLLYHEAFHAYLGTFVYPSREGSLPHWFNEGLAQIFETAIVEVGELRIGHTDSERRVAARAALAKGKLPKLVDLLRSGPKQFVVEHASEHQVSDRYYLASWALAFYLTFDRKVVGTQKLHDYVAALKREVDPVVAFRALVGKPLDEFEKDYHAYLRALRPDGTTGK